MVFGNGVKNIQAAAYNGARTVLLLHLAVSYRNASMQKHFLRALRIVSTVNVDFTACIK